MKTLLLVLLAFISCGCVAVDQWATYEPEPPIGPKEGTHREDGVVYHLKVKPSWKYRDSELLLSSFDKGGPPYRLSLTAIGRDDRRMTCRITKMTVTMPDQSEHDALKGKPIVLKTDSTQQRMLSYQSEKLPLDFMEGAIITVEVQCLTNGKPVTIRASFVGRKRRETESIWEEYGAA